MITLKFHYDASHGWLEVPLSLMYQYDLLSKISTCSYRDKRSAYLEEDCDAAVFLEYIEKQGIQHQCIEINDGDHSPIRNKARF